MWLKDASAAIGIPPAGANVSCAGDRDHEIAVNGGASVAAATQGAIQAQVGQTTLTTDGRQTTQLRVTNTFTEGYVEGVGNLVITLDTSRPSVASSLTANQRGAAFPATQVMRFYPKFILNDEVFQSTTPVQVVSSSVTSFPPEEGTVYVLTNSMVLTSSAGNTISLKPGKAFTITGTS
jgi:hypothetical protein